MSRSPGPLPAALTATSRGRCTRRWFVTALSGRSRLRHLAESRLWLLPLTCVLAVIGLAVALLSVDRSSGFHIVGTGVTGSAGSGPRVLPWASAGRVQRTQGGLSL